MADLREALRSLSRYPIPSLAIETALLAEGLDPDAESDAQTLASRGFRLCAARMRLWLSEAPAISQGGQNYSFSDDQRLRLRRAALAELELLGGEGPAPAPRFGYKGSRL